MRRELAILLLLVVWGGLLRFWDLDRSPVEHFDEGVYASNFWFDAGEGYRYPDRHLYAPPILPMVIEWGHLFFGVGIYATTLNSLLASVGTIVLAWWLVRRVTGPVGGLAAAAMWAMNDVSILYSRTALTESLLCFWMLLAICWAEWVLAAIADDDEIRFGHVGNLAVGCGIVCGMAWLTKYNGWLTLAIITSATLPWAVVNRFNVEHWKRLGLFWGVAVFIALAMWGLYVRTLSVYGGYAAVADNHRQYFVGLAGWGESLGWQLENIWVLSSWTTACGIGLGGIMFVAGRQWRRTGRVDESIPQAESWMSLIKQPGAWLLASWWCGLGVAIPLYTPYPRLLVPWVLASCLGLGVVAGWVWELFGKHRVLSHSNRLSLYACVAAGVVVLVGSLSGPLRSMPAWEDRRALQQAATEMIEVAGDVATQRGRQADQVVFYVYGEPALFYHLSAQDRVAGPIGHLKFAEQPSGNPDIPVFLVVGPHARRSPLFATQWEKSGHLFEELLTIPYQPSQFIARNQTNSSDTPEQITLYRLKRLL